ncbi:MAG: DUF167 domain-containing protein [Sedimentisphaerales bacterium]|nr:DUF167 domain-containing protein [Sedimentisphaerales bacterium]
MESQEFEIRKRADGVRFTVKVVPGSSRTGIGGILGSALKIQVAVPPEKGRANQELVRFLAQLLDMPKSAVSVVSGHRRPLKEIQVDRLTEEQLRQRLEPYIGSASGTGKAGPPT